MLYDIGTPPWLVYLVLAAMALLLPSAVSLLLRQPRYALVIVALAWTLRLLALSVLKLQSYEGGLDGFFPGDDDAYRYDRDATRVLYRDEWLEVMQDRPPFTLVVSAVYRYIGADMALVQLLTLALSVLAVPLLVQMGRQVGGDRGGRVAALLWAILPSGIYWSIRLGKDMWAVFPVLLIGFLVMRSARGAARHVDYLLGAAGGVWVALIRPQFLLPPFLTLTLLLFVGRPGGRGRRAIVLSGMLVIGVLAVHASPVGARIERTLLQATSREGVEYLGQRALSGGSGLAFLTKFPPHVRWVVQLPFSAFAPFPWQWPGLRSMAGRLAAIETALWYGLYYLLWRARRRLWQNREARALLLFAFTILIAVSFGLPNIGALFRYRWAASALLLPMMAVSRPPRETGREVQFRHGSAAPLRTSVWGAPLPEGFQEHAHPGNGVP